MNPPVSVYCDGSLPDGADSAYLAMIVLVGHSGEQIMLRGPSGIELLGLLVRNAMGAAQEQFRKLNAQRDALQQRLAGMGAYNDTLKGQLRLADVAMQVCSSYSKRYTPQSHSGPPPFEAPRLGFAQ